jgi:hypothetical protein
MSSLLSCRLCGQPIKFDDKHISQRSGKKIPLDIDTDEPHDCPVWKNGQHQQQQPQQQSQQQGQPQQPTKQTQQIRFYPCRKGCGQGIYFDASNKSQSDKFIPLSKETGLPHQCPQ